MVLIRAGQEIEKTQVSNKEALKREGLNKENGSKLIKAPVLAFTNGGQF